MFFLCYPDRNVLWISWRIYLSLLAHDDQAASLAFRPTEDFPALQYLDRVDPGGMADLAGLKSGDFILEVSGVLSSESGMKWGIVDVVDTEGVKHSHNCVNLSYPRGATIFGW